MKDNCQHGLRPRIYYVLSGSVMGVWSKIETAFNLNTEKKPQVMISLYIL